MNTFTIEPKGAFSLEEAACFGFGQRHETAYDGTMRMAFCVDGYQRQAGVSVTQDSAGTVHGVISGTVGSGTVGSGTVGSGTVGSGTVGSGTPPVMNADRDAIVAQVARVLSIDHDATGYQALGDEDPVIARLLAVAPGLRPPLFYSPYEAALWAVISQRRPRATAERWRRQLSEAAGACFEVAGQDQWAVPTPARLLELGAGEVAAAAGMEPARAERVTAVAAAATAGKLDAAALAHVQEDEVRAGLRAIPGIGPFYADLILIRATGVTDVFPGNEPRLLGLMSHFYGGPRSGPMTPKVAANIAERWRPWRTWVAVLVRAAGSRVLTPATEPAVV
jgi:DNA-3-methyladenine glycosylase II